MGVGSTIFAVKPGDGSAREQAASCQKVLGGWANIANEYGVRLINAHMGGCELNHTNAILTSKNKNIFTDTSGMASFNNNVVEYAVKTCGSQNIFFGTDCYSCAFQKGRIVFADISESDKENILFKNALREFPKIIEM